MADPDVLVRLTADEGNRHAQDALHLPHNERWRSAALATAVEEETSGARTPAPLGSDLDDADEHALVVRFSTVNEARESPSFPPFNRGLLFGTDPSTCHVLLKRGPGISAKHFGLFVDQQLRFEVRDYSTYGTAVSCNKQNGNELRNNESWVLTKSVHQRPLFNKMVIFIGRFRMQIEFPSHGTESTQYQDNLRTFQKLLEDDANRFAALKLDGVITTVAPSSVGSPKVQDIYYQLQLLGKGAFASVYQAVQARTGDFFAMKVFLRPPDKRQRDSPKPKWLENVEREFSLMRDHRHSNVVEVVALLRREHTVAIVMEYYADGNMKDVHLNETDHMSAFGQVLDGLQHLHSHGLTHRDLKPANLLVRLRPFKVAIADFGLSKIATSHHALKTFCGSLPYAAPEVLHRRGHGTRADIWSLGVMVYQWMYSLPCGPEAPQDDRDVSRWSTEWSELLQKALKEQDDCKLIDLLHRTIQQDPDRRWTAHRCLEFGLCDPPLFKRREHDDVVVCIDAVDDDADSLRGNPLAEKRESRRYGTERSSTVRQGHKYRPSCRM